MNLMTVDGLTKQFGGITAVDNLSFDIYTGEILGLIGPNGAGKSTVLNLLSGTMKPDKGRIIYRGRDITKYRPYKRCWLGISRTYQSVRPFLHLTVLQNIETGLMFGGSRKLKTENNAQGLVKMFDLTDKQHAPVGSLNLFDRKKVEIAKALSTNPQLLMLDEPMAGLSGEEIAQLIQLLQTINSEQRTSIIIVEHVMKAVMTLSTRIIVLHLGKKLAEGKPSEIAMDEQVLKIYLGEKYDLT